MTVSKRIVATKIAVAGVLAVGATVVSAATAAADPPPPPPADPAADPAAPPPAPPSFLGTALAEAGPNGPGWLSQAAGSGAPPDFLLSQLPTPGLPGSQPAAPSLSAMNPQYLLSPGMRLADQGQQSVYSMGPLDGDSPPVSKWDALQRAHGLWHMGMGKLDPDQLGEPLPGTAPPPGTNIPVGLGQNLPDQSPAVPAAPGAPPAPPAPAG